MTGTLSVEGHFCAAHRLPEHCGMCHNLHGHNYRVVLTLEHDVSAIDSKQGFFFDFSRIKSSLNAILKLYDHATIIAASDTMMVGALSDLPEQKLLVIAKVPTVENLSAYIWEQLRTTLSLRTTYQVTVRVTLYETPECSYTVSGTMYV